MDEINFQETSLREAAAANSRSGWQGYIRFHCKKKFSTNKCSCKNKGLLCNEIKKKLIFLAEGKEQH